MTNIVHIANATAKVAPINAITVYAPTRRGHNFETIGKHIGPKGQATICTRHAASLVDALDDAIRTMPTALTSVVSGNQCRTFADQHQAHRWATTMVGWLRI